MNIPAWVLRVCAAVMAVITILAVLRSETASAVLGFGLVAIALACLSLERGP